jgi:hypothetical protein
MEHKGIKLHYLVLIYLYFAKKNNNKKEFLNYQMNNSNSNNDNDDDNNNNNNNNTKKISIPHKWSAGTVQKFIPKHTILSICHNLQLAMLQSLNLYNLPSEHNILLQPGHVQTSSPVAAVIVSSMTQAISLFLHYFKFKVK